MCPQAVDGKTHADAGLGGARSAAPAGVRGTVLAPALSTLLRQNRYRVAFGLAVSGFMLWLAFRAMEGSDVRTSMASASMRWVAVSVVFYWAELGVRILRWRAILAPVRALSFLEVANALLIGYAANNLLPAKLGELFRADFLGRRHHLSRLSAVGSIFVERLLDMCAVLVCAGTGIALLVKDQPGFTSSARGASVLLATGALAAAVLAAILLVILFPGAIGALHARLPRVANAMESVRVAMVSVRQPHVLASLVVQSLLVWLLNGLAMWAILRSVGVQPSPALTVLIMGVAGVAVAMPSAPANLGTLQFAFVLALALSDGATPAGFAAATLVQCFLLGSVTMVGMLLYARWLWLAPASGGRRP